MGTVSKAIADDVVAGMYEDDYPVKTIKYTNAWGDEAYGLVCQHDHPDRYAESDYVRNPTVYWVHP